MARLIPLTQILNAMDNKDREFYDNLTDEQKKEFSGFVMAKWMASIAGNSDLEHYCIASVNHYVNKHLFELANHKKLQWLLLTAASPGVGKLKHEWLKTKPKPADATAPIKKQLLELFPTMKEDDIETLSKIITKKELKQYVKDHGD